MSLLDLFRSLVHREAPPPEAPLDPLVAHALAMIRSVMDPETAVDVVSMGLIREVTVRPWQGAGAQAPDPAQHDNADAHTVLVRMTLTTRKCPASALLVKQVEAALLQAGFHAPTVELVWDPPWSAEDVDPSVQARLHHRPPC